MVVRTREGRLSRPDGTCVRRVRNLQISAGGLAAAGAGCLVAAGQQPKGAAAIGVWLWGGGAGLLLANIAWFVAAMAVRNDAKHLCAAFEHRAATEAMDAIDPATAELLSVTEGA